MKRSRTSCAGLILLGASTGCMTTQGINRYQPNLYSVDQEVGLGKEVARELEKELTLVRHHGLQSVVRDIGTRLRRAAPEPEFQQYPFSFKIVDSPEVNAFSLPGGPIYLNLGLIELTETEDELASVIAHEMSHVAARHATERVTALQLSQIALLVAATTIGTAPALAVEGTRLAYILGVLQYSRGMESEADEMALAMIRGAGYDPRAMVGLFEKLESLRQSDPILLERLFSSHPLPDARREVIAAQTSPATEDRLAVSDSKRYRRVKAIFAKD